MALGKGKKKNTTGTRPKAQRAAGPAKPRRKSAKTGPKKTPARTTTRSADK
jgi:hypothetical protein